MSAADALTGAKPKRRGVQGGYLWLGVPLIGSWVILLWDAGKADNGPVVAALFVGLFSAFWLNGLRAK